MGVTKIIAGVARFPVNFIKQVGEDIKHLNELEEKQKAMAQEGGPLAQLSETQLQNELKRRAAAARQG